MANKLKSNRIYNKTMEGIIRKMRVSDGLCGNKSLAQIVKETGIPLSSVSRHLTVLREEWAERYTATFDQRQHEELARLDWVIAQAADAWERSKAPLTRTVTETVNRRVRNPDGEDGEDPGPMQLDNEKTVRVTEEQVGDPQYLRVIEACISRKCEIQGLNEPQRVVVGFQVLDGAGNVDPGELATAVDAIDAIIARTKAPVALTAVGESGRAAPVESSLPAEGVPELPAG